MNELKYFIITNVITTICALRFTANNYTAYTNEMPLVISNLRGYTSVYIFDANIDILQPPYLSNLGDVEELVIGNCKYLREIREGVLNNSKLKKLKVNISKLKKIDSNALDNMPNLKEVSFIYGRIVKMNSKWFKSSSNVEEFILSHNKIRSLPRLVFKNIVNVRYRLRSQRN